MGYPMAKNLRAGLGHEKLLLVCDVNSEALERFKTETQDMGPVEFVKNGFEAVERAVSIPSLPSPPLDAKCSRIPL
jgi:3-hydroxyisobutyrate dehydrogenase